ncbi:hypothetical protein OIB37_14565 [Streptomyces sp. NBC_00820]|uniref:hypothetical protein n=1 Tax=Streptomyces sp. NBC_00820 TaxID=2975842 RepID=UPI002ED51F90|nr:hypothetical protein OIB37_14565 [Streptomyces sp. NBC_00820]
MPLTSTPAHPKPADCTVHHPAHRHHCHPRRSLRTPGGHRGGAAVSLTAISPTTTDQAGTPSTATPRTEALAEATPCP